ncbi:AraC family transcriptional regulator [Streptomyces sp. SID7760]|nr:AraC family transcriptional regulator [Streptomyces sp. SID7760]
MHPGTGTRRHGETRGDTRGHAKNSLGQLCGWGSIAMADGGELPTGSGVRLLADLALDEVDGRVDTLLVAGAIDRADGAVEPVVDAQVTAWLRRAAPRSGRTGSIRAGAHLPAAAGLLDGRRATTHWLTAARLAAEHPRVTADPDPIFIRSAPVWTCAGVTSGMDMALATVAEDHGRAVALAAARMMVMYVKRCGGQSQFSVPLSAQDAAYVEAARRLLEESDHSLPETAAVSGPDSVDTLHRSFQRRLGTTPAEYRRRFR